MCDICCTRHDGLYRFHVPVTWYYICIFATSTSTSAVILDVLSISQESELCFASSWRKRRGALYWFRWCMRSIFLVEVRCNISVLGYLVWIIPGTYRTVCASSLTTVRLRVPFVCLLIIYLMTGSFLHLIHDTYQPILRLFTCSTSWHGPAISQALPQALPYKPITAMHTSTSYCSML